MNKKSNFRLNTIIYRFSKWYSKVTCKHTILTFKRMDLQDKYVICECDKCREYIYKDF